jgi:hypothetical protein
MSKLPGRLVAPLLLAFCAGGVVAEPITHGDIVTVNGREWAQPDLFLWEPWNSINAVCPNQICNGVLTMNSGRSFEMDGWIWASVADVADMLDSYGVSPPLNGNFQKSEIDSSWAPAFFADGWRETDPFFDLRVIEGLVGGEQCSLLPFANAVLPCKLEIKDDLDPGWADQASRGIWVSFDSSYPTIGAWFYREPSEVPLPSTLPLLAIGLIGLIAPGLKKRQL